jgi:hypothetical protein
MVVQRGYTTPPHHRVSDRRRSSPFRYGSVSFFFFRSRFLLWSRIVLWWWWWCVEMQSQPCFRSEADFFFVLVLLLVRVWWWWCEKLQPALRTIVFQIGAGVLFRCGFSCFCSSPLVGRRQIWVGVMGMWGDGYESGCNCDGSAMGWWRPRRNGDGCSGGSCDRTEMEVLWWLWQIWDRVFVAAMVSWRVWWWWPRRNWYGGDVGVKCWRWGVGFGVVSTWMVPCVIGLVWWLRRICDGCGGDEWNNWFSSMFELFVFGVFPFSFSMEPPWSVISSLQNFSQLWF